MRRLFICFAGALLILSAARAQELVVYPNAGQDAKTQTADEQACDEWARDKSGFDPARVAKPEAAAQTDASAEPNNSIVGDFRRAQVLDLYRRAFAACMEGRNYTVR